LARPAPGSEGDGDGEGPASPAAFIDPVAMTAEDERSLAGRLSDESLPKALHDAKGRMHALAARGLRLRGLTSDTAPPAYPALPGQRSFDLADLALRYTRRELRGDAAVAGQLTLDMAAESETGAGEAGPPACPAPAAPPP